MISVHRLILWLACVIEKTNTRRQNVWGRLDDRVRSGQVLGHSTPIHFSNAGHINRSQLEPSSFLNFILFFSAIRWWLNLPEIKGCAWSRIAGIGKHFYYLPSGQERLAQINRSIWNLTKFDRLDTRQTNFETIH